ncbi:MAG: hypothetical protein JJT87_06810 [Halomonas sp.]|nr:hypothetical protein [Halomonas sp.]MCC5901620.1 hypothetical protein [Halomonas sp.]
MERKLYLSVSRKQEGDLSDFIDELYKHEIVEDYIVNIVSDPVFYFRDDFVNEVVKNGFGSMLKPSIVMDDITTPSMHFDDVEKVFHKFVETLKPIEVLFVVDPYFYPKKLDVDEVSKKFVGLISPIVNELKEIVVISNGKNKSSVFSYIDNLQVVNKMLKVSNYFSEKFHDRFWLNAEGGRGIVVGASINGIGKKISLVDKLARSDVQKILNELAPIIEDEA